MNTPIDSTKQAQTTPNPEPLESVVITERFIDKENDPQFSIAVSLEGFVIMSATHRQEDGKLDSCFDLITSNGEPEMVMKDAIFKGTSVINPRGFFNGEHMG